MNLYSIAANCHELKFQLAMMRSIVAGKVMIYLLGYVVAKINQDVSVQRSMVWQLTSVVWCFDLDGTLHQQDMFGSFLRYLLRRQPLNALLVLPLLPIIAIALLIKVVRHAGR